MNKIFLNIDTGNYVVEDKVLSFNNYILLKEFKEHIQELAGFLILVDNKVLLVKPKKFKGLKNKWSIPKGKVGNSKKFKTALKELKEETGIELDENIKNESEKVKVYYKKSNKLKELTVYVIELNKSDINVDLDNKWEVEKNHIDGKEIYKAKFFTKTEAMKKIEMGQMPLLKIM